MSVLSAVNHLRHTPHVGSQDLTCSHGQRCLVMWLKYLLGVDSLNHPWLPDEDLSCEYQPSERELFSLFASNTLPSPSSVVTRSIGFCSCSVTSAWGQKVAGSSWECNHCSERMWVIHQSKCSTMAPCLGAINGNLRKMFDQEEDYERNIWWNENTHTRDLERIRMGLPPSSVFSWMVVGCECPQKYSPSFWVEDSVRNVDFGV